MIAGLTVCFDGLVDPQVTRRCDYRLIDILIIAVSAVIACAEAGGEDIELYRRGKQAWRGRIEQVFGYTCNRAGAITSRFYPPPNRYAAMVAPGRGAPQL